MKKIMILIILAVCTLPLCVTQTKATENLVNIVPYADKKEWIYKIIDGVLFKRLFNVSKDRWEGPWIKV